MSRHKYNGRELEFGCVLGTLRYNGERYRVKGQSGTMWGIVNNDQGWWLDNGTSCWPYPDMKACLIGLKFMDSKIGKNLKNKAIKPQKVIHTDGTNAEIVRLRAENKELEETVDHLEDLSIEMDNKIQSLEGELSLQVTYKEQARANDSGRVGQIRKLEAACQAHRANIAALEKQLSIWEFWMGRLGR